LFFLLQNPEVAAGPQGSSTPKMRDPEAGGLAEDVVPRELREEDYEDDVGEEVYGADVREADDSDDNGGGRQSLQLRLVHRSAAAREQEEKSKEEERERFRQQVHEEVRQCLEFTDTDSESSDVEMKDESPEQEPMDES
jgi:hypothetical protein